MGRRPRPQSFDRGGLNNGRGPPVGRGTNGISVTLSQENGLGLWPSQGPPDPRQTATVKN